MLAANNSSQNLSTIGTKFALPFGIRDSLAMVLPCEPRLPFKRRASPKNSPRAGLPICLNVFTVKIAQAAFATIAPFTLK